jgi:four helix bundle protein
LGEEYETEVWLDYCKDCGYINEKTYSELTKQYNEVRKILISLIKNPGKFCK